MASNMSPCARSPTAEDELLTMTQGLSEVKNLEKQFEEDFASHLEKTAQRRQIKLGAIGAGIAGAATMGIAAAPLLPGLAFAAAAGASGYGWAKRKGKQQLEKHVPPTAACASDRPTLRRLKYLVKWAHWQLLSYDSATSEQRVAVLDEVVRAFSPWVQRIFLLDTVRGRMEATRSGCKAEVKEVTQHLAPLVLFLMRKAAHKALELGREAVGVATLVGTLDARYAERCRIVYPTVVETVAFFERVGWQEAEAQSTKVTSGTPKSPKEGIIEKRKRLTKEATSIRELIERPDVVQALAGSSREIRGPLGLSPSTTIEEGSDEDVEDEDSVAFARFVVPPEGAENEPGQSGDEDGSDREEDYYSCSDPESDNEVSPTKRSMLRPQFLGGVSAPSGSFSCRMQTLKQGVGPNTWQSVERPMFSIRSASYLRDKSKIQASKPLIDVECSDVMRIGPDGPVFRAMHHPDMYANVQRKKGDKRFMFIQNWIFPPYQAVITGAVDFDSPGLSDDSPSGRLFKRFLNKSNQERKDMFKLIMSIEDGPWLVQRAVPKKPLIPGRSLKMDSFHAPGDHLEIVFDVSSGKAEQVTTGIVMKAMKSIEFVLAAVLEGRSEDELPEAILTCCAIKQANTALFQAPGPDRSEDGA